MASLAAGVAALGWWQLSTQSEGRFTRQQYDRIRLGMTPAEVALAIGGSYSYRNAEGFGEISPYDDWERVTYEIVPKLVMFGGEAPEAWHDESSGIWVFYRDGKVVMKQMRIHVPSWKTKARDWLNRVRAVVGW